MEKLKIKKLNSHKEVLSERICIRVTPDTLQQFENIALKTNRTVGEVGRMALEWALKRIEIEDDNQIESEEE